MIIQEDLIKQNEELKKTLLLKEKEIQFYRNQINDCVRSNVNLEMENNGLKSKVEELKQTEKYLSARLESATKSCVGFDINNANLKNKIAELEEQLAYECGCNENLVDLQNALEVIMHKKINPSQLKDFLNTYESKMGKELSYPQAVTLFCGNSVSEDEFKSLKKVLKWFK